MPLNNATYPRGLLLYAASYDSLNEMPLKLPVFPKKNIGTMVSCASPFNIKMIDNLKNRINKIFREKKISQNALNIINTVLDEDYCSQPVINQDSYSKQSVIINNLLWQRMFSAEIRVPDLVYIEMEQIVRVLLQNDLTNPGSLACRVLFDASVRDYLLDMLDGVRGCWNRKNLVSMVNTGKRLRHETGTVFFWGADELGRRIPLYIVTDSRGSDFLWGADDCGNIWKMPYNTDSVMQGLYEKNIIPSLFTCFLTFSFARGLVCIGGDFQGEYLAQMKKAVAGILKKTGDEESSLIVENVRTDIYQDGMIAFMCPFKEKFLIPAGTLEIIGSGGITKGDMEKVLNMSVMEAHIAGLFETFKDAGGHKLYDFEWKEKIARDILRLLHEKIVIKYP
ncbi:Uncharacterized protein dnl_48450 [Desulfonema limicola]|uniref:Uncharacterized protein n=1 Tax=Desulfonema limicola TaxID=45656 RepID=A0A975GID1_9BACT|nr:Uncharacterized protein dnl_48450 [Desulfonema limicola]